MHYIINKKIKFTPKINEVSTIDNDGNNLLLSNAATRLLRELINNSNNTMSRSVLLQHVWEDYGFKPSNNNLYMAISELRKAFISLGEHKSIILTVPKVGLKLDSEIDIIEDTHPPLKEIAVTNNYEGYGLHKKKSSEGIWKKRYYVTLLLITLPLIYFLYSKETFTAQPLPEKKAFTYGNCNVYLINQLIPKDIEPIKTNVVNLLISNNIECQGDQIKNIFYQMLSSPQKSAIEYTIGICTNKDIHCTTIKKLAG